MASPYILANQGNQEIQLVQQKDQVLILHVEDHQVRRVRLNQPHPERVTPSWHGDSVGHYEGDTLVVDTVGIKVGPLSMVDIFGTPHTEALHVVERYRLVDHDVAKSALEWAMNEHGYRNAGVLTEGMVVDTSYRGKGLQIQFTVDDAGVFTTPWSGSVSYLRSGREWIESACAENVHDYSTGEDVKVPTAGTPESPSLSSPRSLPSQSTSSPTVAVVLISPWIPYQHETTESTEDAERIKNERERSGIIDSDLDQDMPRTRLVEQGLLK
jgi:hypothetical protein